MPGDYCPPGANAIPFAPRSVATGVARGRQRGFINSSLDALTLYYNCSQISLEELVRARRMAIAAREELRAARRGPVTANLAYNAYVRETNARVGTHAASHACVRRSR
jgi:hypothetical protein